MRGWSERAAGRCRERGASGGGRRWPRVTNSSSSPEPAGPRRIRPAGPAQGGRAPARRRGLLQR
jgi:hypothetical protein